MLEILFHNSVIVALLCGFSAIAMTFYLGRGKMKEIDRLVHGYEIAGDSIFFQLTRLPGYGGAFAWRWSAKRSKLLHIRDEFDKDFQCPFIITHYLYLTVGVLMVLIFVLDTLFLPEI